MHLVWAGVSLMAHNAPCKDRRRVWSRWLNTIGQDLFCDFMDGGELEINENSKKTRPITSPVIFNEQAWSIKNSLCGQKHNLVFAGPKRVITRR